MKMLVSESNIFKPDVMMVNIVEMDGATWVTEVQRTTTVEKMKLLALTHVTSHHNIDRWNRKRKLFRPRACTSINPATQSDVASDRWTNWKMWCVYSFLYEVFCNQFMMQKSFCVFIFCIRNSKVIAIWHEKISNSSKNAPRCIVASGWWVHYDLHEIYGVVNVKIDKNTYIKKPKMTWNNSNCHLLTNIHLNLYCIGWYTDIMIYFCL